VDVVEAGGVAGLAAEALEVPVAPGQAGPQHLNGDGTAQLGVLGLIDARHAARGDVGKYLVLTEAEARLEEARRHASSAPYPPGERQSRAAAKDGSIAGIGCLLLG
jgi:hypothetical protein